MSAGEPGAKAQLRFWLEHRGHRVELRAGENLIGRGAACQLVLDDILVSREHACITISPNVASLVDRASANGVFVNGERISAPRVLTDGDRIDIGKQEMALHAAEASSAARAKRVGEETLHGMTAPLVAPALPPEDRESESTSRAHVFDMLGGVADKALALGRSEAAEKMLEGLLEGTLEQVSAGRAVDTETLEVAARYAIKLAGATRNGRWVDYIFALYLHVNRPLPRDVIDELHAVLRSVGQVDLGALRRYLAVLQAHSEGFTPTERFLVQRIEGLERIAALK